MHILGKRLHVPTSNPTSYYSFPHLQSLIINCQAKNLAEGHNDTQHIVSNNIRTLKRVYVDNLALSPSHALFDQPNHLESGSDADAGSTEKSHVPVPVLESLGVYMEDLPPRVFTSLQSGIWLREIDATLSAPNSAAFIDYLFAYPESTVHTLKIRSVIHDDDEVELDDEDDSSDEKNGSHEPIVSNSDRLFEDALSKHRETLQILDVPPYRLTDDGLESLATCTKLKFLRVTIRDDEDVVRPPPPLSPKPNL